MSPEFEKYLARMCDLIENGKLPDTAIHRLFYTGHKYLGNVEVWPQKIKCITCDKEWSFEKGEKQEICHHKSTFDEENEIFDITDRSNSPLWKCVKCDHKWQGKNGNICPSCKTEKK